MSNFVTVRDLHKDVLDRCSEVTDSNSDFYSKSLDYINRAHLAVLAGSNELGLEVGEPWPWAKSKYPGVLNLVAPYETGTVTVTADSASGTFSVAPSVSLAGYFLKVQDRPEYFRISSHSAASTSFTLDAAYTDTSGSGLSFTAYKFEYQLASGILRLIAPMRVYRIQGYESDNTGHIDHVDLDALYDAYPLQYLQRRIPIMFAMSHRDQLGVITVRFSSIADQATRVEYEYIPVPSKLVSESFLDASVDVTANTITIASHGLTDGQIVQFDNEDGSLPAPLTKETPYYVRDAATNTFKVTATVGGTAVDITSAAGGGTHYVSNLPLVPQEHRVLLSYCACYFLMLDMDDNKAQEFKALAQAGFESLVQANKRERIHAGRYHLGRLVPRLEQISSNKRFFVQSVT